MTLNSRSELLKEYHREHPAKEFWYWTRRFLYWLIVIALIFGLCVGSDLFSNSWGIYS